MDKNNKKKAIVNELKKDISKSLTIPVFVAVFALLGILVGAYYETSLLGLILGGLVGLSWGLAFVYRKKMREKR